MKCYLKINSTGPGITLKSPFQHEISYMSINIVFHRRESNIFCIETIRINFQSKKIYQHQLFSKICIFNYLLQKWIHSKSPSKNSL